ncbi:cysteine synthase [Ceratobasidium sp. AG-Ba]|nr:cysteine synthase [Ceratobasidium sp. AG-Ba]
MSNPLNVFSGKNALVDYYNPDCNPPLPLVELPDHPFVADGVRIYAKMMTALPAGNVKALPALNMLLRGREEGSITEQTRRIVEYSSGNTVISLSIIANILGIGDTCAYISNKTSQAKINLLRFFGLELTLFGGPAQVEPADVNGGIFAALKDGHERPDYHCPGQYSNPQNSEAHERWTGPQILAQLPDISVFAAALGTSGTMTGTGAYLKRNRPNLVNVGVFTAPRDRVPGPRPIDLIQSVDLPWWDVIDCSEHVDSHSAYKASLELCRIGLLGGPSSGLAYVGLLKYLQKQKDAGGLNKLRDARGNISCAFIVCDLPYQYIGEYVSKLGESELPPIHNSELLNVDTYPYGVDWKISAKTAQRKINSYRAPLTPPSSPTQSDASTDDEGDKPVIVLDLREIGSLPRVNAPNVQYFPVCSESTPNPFSDPPTLASQWRLMDSQLGMSDKSPLGKDLKEKVVVVMCYEGHTSSICVSVLRSRGIEAYWVDGGVNAWGKLGK